MNENISTAVEAIKTAILHSQYQAAQGVNRVQLILYFSIGRYLSLQKSKETWGSDYLAAISDSLRKQLPGLRGFSAENLKKMRQFYENWLFLDANRNSGIAIHENTNSGIAIPENKKSVIAITDFELSVNADNFPIDDFFKVPFAHHIQIFSKTKKLEERYFYIQKVAAEHLSVTALATLIKNDAFKHQGQMPNNFSTTIAPATLARKAVMMFKDEYLLNFINIEEIGERDAADIDERVVEQQIIHNIKNFIMTFGHDFTFVGNQYHLEIYGVEHFPDLLFFNRELNALVVVELKMGEFKTSYLGQLFGYLQILDDHVRKPHENQPIGIVLCQKANRAYAEYAVRDYSKPMGVATYKTLEEMPDPLRNALPDMQKMLEIINNKTHRI